MLFKPRGVQPQKEEKPKNQMTLADMLAFRDTWTDIPSENFSVERILLKAHLEKQRKAEVPKLVTSENGFRVRDKTEMDESELELRRVQGSLNKLTDKNFDSVTREMLSTDLISNPFVLKGAVNIIFSKAVAEPVFSSLYARLCARIANYERDVVAEAENNPAVLAKLEVARKELATNPDEPPRIGDFVRSVLVSRCQAFYDHYVKQPVPESPEAEEHLRKQNMSNIKFVGELYVKSMVTTVVIAWIASHALGLGWGTETTKASVSDVDLEMMYNLLMVVGKRFDEHSNRAVVDGVWEPLMACAEDPAFSMRTRFLLLNLIDLRKNGWKAREVPLPTSSTTDEGQQPQQQQQQQSHPHRSMHRASSMQQQDGPTGNRRAVGDINSNPMAGARRGERVTSYVDLSQFGPNAKGPYPPPPPPPPFDPSMPPPPPPPFPGTAPVLSEEDRKLFALAQPPPSLTDDVEKKILSILRDAVTDGDWTAAATALGEAVPGEQKHTCLMCAAYTATKKMCMSSLEEDRITFTTALNVDSLFDLSSLCRGYAWFFADSVANNYKEDVPRVTSRFVQRLVDTKALTFLVMMRDVVLRTANYLDAMYVPLEAEGGSWEEEFIEVWSSALTQWCAKRADDADLKDATKIIECIAGTKQRKFVGDIIPDFLMELNQNELLPDDAVNEWVAHNSGEEKYKAFAEQLQQLFPQ